MELRSDVTGTRPVNQLTGIQQVFPAGDLREEVSARLMALAVGRPVAAEVLSQTESGASMVRVADTVVQMDLPPDAKVGEKVTLTLLAREPRLTFLFERDPAAHSMVSNTGRLIDAILRAVSQEGPSTAAVLSGKTPLLPASPGASAAMMPAGLASSLESALSTLFGASGLFYESHLAQWVAGNRTQAELMQEPQARLPRQDMPVQERAGQGREAGAMNHLETLQEKSWVRSLISRATAKMAEVLPHQQRMDGPEQVVEQHAANIIRMQLDAMENRKIVWQGELWPGQEMEWAVEDETPRRQKQQYAEAASGSWQSTLKITLPLLGEISASMRLTGDAAQVRLVAADDVSTAVLRQFGPELVSALEAVGAKLDYFMVNDETA
ncbi:MAG: flagellar hook-length control protein FliK [Burkholderiaceae bacterium]|jgi:hypothetical protein|nr:flagellar hook-length control protein FliK [Burkholderiaceae bacterium]